MIHPTAIVHPGAKLGANVSVGAYSLIGENVEIGDGTRTAPARPYSGAFVNPGAPAITVDAR